LSRSIPNSLPSRRAVCLEKIDIRPDLSQATPDPPVSECSISGHDVLTCTRQPFGELIDLNRRCHKLATSVRPSAGVLSVIVIFRPSR
jgi:hypothetical protein